MLTERKMLRFEPEFITLLNQNVCQHIGYSPGRCFAVMLSLFNTLPIETRDKYISLAKYYSKHYKKHNSYETIYVQINISKKLSRLFKKNNDRIIIIAVLLYHNVLTEKVGV